MTWRVDYNSELGFIQCTYTDIPARVVPVESVRLKQDT